MDHSLNRMWSELAQTPGMLDKTREIRFRETYRELLLRLLRLKPGMKIADIGCGPGTLTRKLALWLGTETTLIGIDRDSGMLEYARQKADAMGLKNISYLQNDALNLELPDNSLDACISSSVLEHVEPYRFLKEQQRICKSGGVVSVISNRTDRSIYAKPEGLPEKSEREKELWQLIEGDWEERDRKQGFVRYLLQPDEIVKIFVETGFMDIQVDGIAFQLCIDDHRNSLAEKLAIWESERQIALDGIKLGIRKLDEPLPEGYAAELEKLVEERMNQRLRLIQDGVKVWDFSITMGLIVSGVKR
ncbi:MAG TPA: class I SAM-dependent methyltransferase [Bacillota bacterium]|nr:class I SAM-dependent methyltransferase [Bacillota bacterium]